MASLNLISQEVCILLDLSKVLFNQFESVWITNLLVLDLQTSFVLSDRSQEYYSILIQDFKFSRKQAKNGLPLRCLM